MPDQAGVLSISHATNVILLLDLAHSPHIAFFNYAFITKYLYMCVHSGGDREHDTDKLYLFRTSEVQ